MTTELPRPEDLQVDEIIALIPDAATAGRVFDALFDRWTQEGLASLRRTRVNDRFEGVLNSGMFDEDEAKALETRAEDVKAVIASSSEIDQAEEDAAEIVVSAIADVTYRVTAGFMGG